MRKIHIFVKMATRGRPTAYGCGTVPSKILLLGLMVECQETFGQSRSWGAVGECGLDEALGKLPLGVWMEHFSLRGGATLSLCPG